MGHQVLGHLLEKAVPLLVATGIVHLLEIVQVQQDQGKGCLPPLHPGCLPLQGHLQGSPVGQAGEGTSEGLLPPEAHLAMELSKTSQEEGEGKKDDLAHGEMGPKV